MQLSESKTFEEYFKILISKLINEKALETEKIGTNLNNQELERIFNYVLIRVMDYARKNKMRQAQIAVKNYKLKWNCYFINYNDELYMLTDIPLYEIGFSKIIKINPYYNTVAVTNLIKNANVHILIDELNVDTKTNLDDIVNYLKKRNIDEYSYLFSRPITELDKYKHLILKK